MSLTFGLMLYWHCLVILNFEKTGPHIHFALNTAKYVADPAMDEKELETVVMDKSVKEFYGSEIREMEPEEEVESRENC